MDPGAQRLYLGGSGTKASALAHYGLVKSGDTGIEVGELLRSWRRRRGMTQLDLALAADLSAKHLSFLETGRSTPSRAVLLRLGRILDVPLRERNVLLTAAGYSAAYRKSKLTDPELAQVRRALRFLLSRHEPYPALAVDPGWSVLMANDAYVRLTEWLTGMKLGGGGGGIHDEPPIAGSNALIPLFDPDGLKPMITNFDEVAPIMLMRTHRDAVRHPAARDLLRRLLKMPGCPSPWSAPIEDAQLLVPLDLGRDGVRVSIFSTLTSLGTAQDITATEIHIETFFPADAHSEAFFEESAASALPPG